MVDSLEYNVWSVIKVSVGTSYDKGSIIISGNIKRCSEQQQRIHDEIISKSEQKVKTILDDAEREKLKRINDAVMNLEKHRRRT